jgi:hypothetical protein
MARVDRAMFLLTRVIALIFYPGELDESFQLKYVLNSKLQLTRELQIG